MTEQPKDWELRIRNAVPDTDGGPDAKLAMLFFRAPFPGSRQATTVDNLDEPELRNPEGDVVARGEEAITKFLSLVHESTSR